MYQYVSYFLFLIIFSTIHQEARAAPHQRTFRLCSRSLSDAMFLVCKDRGFYEPYSYTDGIELKSGPGLVDECCYQACSYEQLEQYCKPLPNGERSNNAGIEASLRIVNLPYASKPKEEQRHDDEATLKNST